MTDGESRADTPPAIETGIRIEAELLQRESDQNKHLHDERPASFATRAIHSDDGIAAHRAVAPAMHVSTTFRYNDDPEQLVTGDVNIDVSRCLAKFIH